MDLMDLIVYAVRDGYEIKVWLREVPRDASKEQLEKMARAEYERVGVELEENESFVYEAF